MLNQPTALLRRHVVELRQPVPHRLLCLWRKVAKTRLIRQSALLFRKRKVTVTIHPLRQMLLLLPLPLSRSRQCRMYSNKSARPAATYRLASRHSRTSTQQQGSKRWLDATPKLG
jgi:hypothetical protein